MARLSPQRFDTRTITRTITITNDGGFRIQVIDAAVRQRLKIPGASRENIARSIELVYESILLGTCIMTEHWRAVSSMLVTLPTE